MSDPVQLTEQYRKQILRLRVTGAAALVAIWQSLRSIDESEVESFALRVTPLLAGMQGAAAALTVSYLQQLGAATPLLAGLVIEQDLRHPFIGAWSDLKQGRDLSTALTTGADRTASLADERVVLTQRQTAVRADEDPNIVGWRRVPQGSTCSFCIRAATQRYHSAEAAGNVGHRNKGVQYCDCDVVPILGHVDPGQVINRPMLDAWKQAQGPDAPAYFDATDLTAAPRP